MQLPIKIIFACMKTNSLVLWEMVNWIGTHVLKLSTLNMFENFTQSCKII